MDPGKSIYLNTCFDVFLFIQNDLYVNKARGIILGIINVNMHRAGIEIMILTKREIFIDVIFVILFLWSSFDSCLKISLREYSFIVNKHDQKLINIFKNQMIYGGFFEILIFRVSLSRTHLQSTNSVPIMVL